MLNYEKEKQKKKKCPVVVDNVVSFLEINTVENVNANTSQLNFKIDNTASEDLEKIDMNFLKPDNFIPFKNTPTNFEEIPEKGSSQNVVDKIDSENSNTGGKSIRPDSFLSQALHNDKSSSPNCGLETINNDNSKSIISDPKEDKSVIQKVISVEKINDNIDKSDVSLKENDNNLKVILPEPTSAYNGKKEYSSIKNQRKNEHDTKDQLLITCPDKSENDIDSRMCSNKPFTQNSVKSGNIKKNISDSGDKDNLDSLLTLKGKKAIEKCELEAIVSQTDESVSQAQCEIEEGKLVVNFWHNTFLEI